MDTTIWTRFTQPANLVWAADEATRREVAEAIAAASITAARFAAVVGPHRASAAEFWKRLFQQTYRAELRVERPGREEQIIAHDRRRYDTLLPLAWQAAGIGFEDDGRTLAPHLSDQDRRTFGQAWRRRRRTGKLLNTARLLKASMTFEGAARYGAWKVERHTGVPVHLTPWRERHPVLAAPGVLFRVWRSRRAS